MCVVRNVEGCMIDFDSKVCVIGHDSEQNLCWLHHGILEKNLFVARKKSKNQKKVRFEYLVNAYD
jgi:hypothetical protein